MISFSKNVTRLACACLLIVGLVLFSGGLNEDTTIESDSVPAKNVSSIANMEARGLQFTENFGQIQDDSRFHVQGAEHTVLFYEAKISFRRGTVVLPAQEIVLEFEGPNKSPRLDGIGQLPGVAHFYRGSDPEDWQTNVPTFSGVYYAGLYPGIDMAYDGAGGVLKSEFYVEPESDYRQIRFRYDNVKSVTIDENGALVLSTPSGQLIESAPVAYQEIERLKTHVPAEFVIHDDGSVGFSLGAFDENYEVIIDPELVFSTIIDNSSTSLFNGVDVDAEGNLVLAGSANRFFPTSDVIAESNHAAGLGNDGLLVKLDGATGDIIYSALFGGSRLDNFRDVELGPNGDIYLTGLTASDDFPTLNPVQATRTGRENAFLVILSSTGVLSYSTYLGGTERDWGVDLSVDGAGNVFIVGRTESPDFPFINGFQPAFNGGDPGSGFPSDAFVVKFNSLGTVDFATYLGGTGDDAPCGIAVHVGGEVTIGNTTTSTDFPVLNAFQGATAGGESDVSITRLNSAGDGLIYSTYFGGSNIDACSGLVVGVDGDVFMSGTTVSNDLPIIGGDPFVEADEADGIVLMFDNTGAPVYAVRTNTPGFDEFDTIDVDDTNEAFASRTLGDEVHIFVKPVDAPLELNFSFPEPDVGISDAALSDNGIVLAGSFFPVGGKMPDANSIARDFFSTNSQQSGGDPWAASIGDLFETEIVNGLLRIQIKEGTRVGLKPGAKDGKLTINGVSTDIDADDIENVQITGTEGPDEIDASDVTRDNFPELKDFVTLPPVNVDGKGGDDTITGSSTEESAIEGGPGNDTLIGGDNSDRLRGGSGNDNIFGNGGNDNLNGGIGDDIVNGGTGNDTMGGDDGNDTLFGGDGNDKMDGDDGDDVLEGGDGNDTISGGRDNDFLVGEAGNDVLDTDKEDELADGGSGFDRVTVSPNTSKRGYLYAASKHEADFVILRDESGIDTLDYSGLGSGIEFDLDTLNQIQLVDNIDFQLMLDGIFEVVIGTEFDDTISVRPLPDTTRFVDGGGGNDVLNYASVNLASDDGSTISTVGSADVMHSNMETVNLSIITSVVRIDDSIPATFSLSQNFPNPFNPTTAIQYELPEASEVRLVLYNTLGREVETLVSRRQQPGRYSVSLTAQNLASGIYFYVLSANEFTSTQKMILLK